MVKHLVAGSVRNAVLDRAALQSQHKHELRQDFKGRLRTVRDTPPLIYKAGSAPDLVSAYDEWSAGCRRNKAAADNLALHAMVHFPSDLIPLDGTPQEIASAEKFMLDHAVRFINERHGGDAVFWARLDRDEEGRHNVDVFYAPRYTKHTKTKGAERWISLTKFDKEKALERYGQVPKLDVRKTANGRKTVVPEAGKTLPATSLFWRGKALQTDFYEYLRDTAKIKGVERGEEKHTHGKDWQSVEDYKAQKTASKIKELQQRGMRMQHKIKEQQKKIAEQEAVIASHADKISRFKSGFFGTLAEAKAENLRQGINAGVDEEMRRTREHVQDLAHERSKMLVENHKLSNENKQLAKSLKAETGRAEALDAALAGVVLRMPEGMRQKVGKYVRSELANTPAKGGDAHYFANQVAPAEVSDDDDEVTRNLKIAAAKDTARNNSDPGM